ncbi:hypothetical protein ASE67_05285 [Sphingomonas sp. Leaf23]|uniref:hypothetical protein n=1 Tax=Sphingomonas sp. Leaf23 TaxID=1735689 RepID=UPI0006FFB7B3|nr:hypothetical protein [Sphingomonas sp. Leaf23]KQM87152.1 hypothetical protein ASE67_05285 [Sphingomonas sp. Leaf23]
MTLLPPAMPVALLSVQDDSKAQALAEIDPARPIADEMAGQALSMFGREDLIAATSDDYKPTGCPPVAGAGGVIETIVQRARATSVVIVNESHERSEHRGFAARVARALRPLGYDTLAMETLSNPTSDQFVPPYRIRPNQPFLEDLDGYYLSEAGFGRLGRQAKALGYHLLAYEEPFSPTTPKLSPEESITRREIAQAEQLATYIAAHPEAKLLVYVGYSHATEVPRANGQKWMATRLKAMTGIDPLTVSQTTCRGGGRRERLAVLPADQPVGTFDLIVDHPSARFVRGRPAWRRVAGDRSVSIPKALRPARGWRIVEARPVGESEASVPMDRVAIRPGEVVALLLPPGRYQLKVLDVPAVAHPDGTE